MTSRRWLSAAAVATLAIGCGTQPPDPAGGDPATVAPTTTHLPPASPPPTAACAAAGPPGSVLSERAITGGAILAVDADGDVFYTADHGIVKETADGERVYAFPYGSVLAVDAAGDAYVAGSFTSPIDLGAGEMTPMGNIDVFVAELSPRGELVFARQLGLCGDGVESLALARDGRIAVSGTAMGTAILDGRGRILDQLYPVGRVAFDSRGNLVIAGAFSDSLDLGDGHVLTTTGPSDFDGYVVELDRNLRYKFSTQLGDATLPVDVGGYGTLTTPRAQGVAGVAIGPHDQIALVGAFRYEMELFGQVLKMRPDFPSGQLAGGFVAKLDASGQVVFTAPLLPSNAGRPISGEIIAAPFGVLETPGVGIAVDRAGNVIVSAQTAGDASGPFAYPQLQKLDATTGNTLFGPPLWPSGYGLGVTTDACGDILWADLERQGPSLGAVLRKVAR